jgi:hypothetical protein
MKKNIVSHQRVSEYYTVGSLDTAQEIWICFHGYGQLAELFGRKFENLGDKFFVVPEGLSKFYLDGNYDKTGASWMTRHSRELEIQNQQYYLEAMMQELFGKNWKDKTYNLLAFSQGNATASRFADFFSLKINRFILWAGKMSYDTYNFKKNIFANTDATLVYGLQDQYLSFLNIEEHLEQIVPLFKSFKILTFEGTHKMDVAMMKNVLEKNAIE